MKTIAELNHRVWYRFIKVVYVLIILFSITVYNITVFANRDFQRIDQRATIIQCSVGDKKEFSPKSIGIKIRDTDLNNNREFNYRKYFESYNDYSIGKIFSACYGSNITDVYYKQKVAELELLYLEGIPKDNRFLLMDYLAFGRKVEDLNIDFSFHVFDIIPVYTYIQSLLLLIGNLGILLVFEAIRRVFYYIVLGKIKPSK